MLYIFKLETDEDISRLDVGFLLGLGRLLSGVSGRPEHILPVRKDC
jgi:hypothetical protein